jgi:hypothetical protein
MNSLAGNVDGGVASTLEVCVHLPGHAASQHKGDEMKYQKLTPNLVVRDVAASVNFDCSVLGFQPGMKVPDDPPYVFASVVRDGVEIFFNAHKAVQEDYPALVSRPIGGTMTLYIEVEGIEDVLRAVEKSGA